MCARNRHSSLHAAAKHALGRLARRRRRAAQLSARACMQPSLCRFKREPVRKRDRRNHREAVLRVHIHRRREGRRAFGLPGVPRNRRHHRRLEGRLQPELHACDSFAENRHGICVGRAFGAARRYADICGRPLERRQPRRIRRAYHRRGRLRAHQARVQPRWPEFSGSALAAHRRARIPSEARQNRA